MTKDEELKDAREWLNSTGSIKAGTYYDTFEELVIAYHHHRLEDAKAGTTTFWLTNILLHLPEEKIIDIVNQLVERITHPKCWQPLPNPPKEV